MKTFINKFGEQQTNWESHKHPNIPNFMQVVKYMHIQNTEGKNSLYWSLRNSSANDKHLIPNITLSKAQLLYTDQPIEELTEEDLENWLLNNK